MTDFTLSDEQREYQKLAHDFGQRELAPAAHKFDLSADLPIELLRKAWDTGLVHPQLPEPVGGLGLNLVDGCIIAEELARGCAGIAAALETSALAILPLINAGTSEQQKRFIEPLAASFALAGLPANQFTFCTPAQCAVTARQTGSGYELSGRIDNMFNASTAEWYLIVAAVDDKTANGKGAEARSVFAVDTKSAGIKVGERRQTLGLKALDIGAVEFQNVAVSAQSLIGGAGSGADLIAAVKPHVYTLLAASCVGLAQSGLQHAIRYSKERHTFKVPIAQHQAVAFMIADMAKDIEAARLLVRQSATLIDGKKADLARAAQAKAFAQETAMKVATDAVQVFGGYGYSKEYPVEKLMRDAKMYQLLDGSSHELKGNLGRRMLAAV